MSYSAGIVAVVVIAQAAAHDPTNWWQPIVNTGAIGCVLLWFMFRMEKRISKNTEILSIATQMLGAAVLASKHKDEAISELVANLQEQAKRAMDESKTSTG